MSKILELLYTEYKNVYGLEMKKKFSTPKIYHGGKDYDLNKRWYVYYSYRNPETGKLERQSPIFAKFNQLHKSKKERLKNFKVLRDALEELLEQGYSPYKDKDSTDDFSARSVLEYALILKKSTVATSTYKGYMTRVGVFKSYLKRKG